MFMKDERKGMSTVGGHTAQCNESEIRAFESWQRMGLGACSAIPDSRVSI